MKKTLSDRVLQVLDELEISQVELASIAKCTKGAVNQWIKYSKADSKMDPEFAYNIAEVTPYEPRWLMLGEGPDKKQATDKRILALIDHYTASDDRGRDLIMRVAEQESNYNTEENAAKYGTS